MEQQSGVSIDHTFVINLKKRTDRWNTINKSFSGTGIKLMRWNAVYGKDLKKDMIKKITTPFCNRFCSDFMIGCWLSHYTLWQWIVKKNLDNVLILEDDAVPVGPI